MQAHGRTDDSDSDLTFDQDADDTALLLKKLAIEKADFFGCSNNGTTALQLAIRPAERVDIIEYLGEITTLKSDTKESELVAPTIEKFLNKTAH
ncbi:hypothetical protein GCM10027299_40630 [Larkinella ripae]